MTLQSNDIPVMTETEEPGQFYEGPTIPVRVEEDNVKHVREDAAPRASYFQMTLASGQQPVQVLSRSPLRHRAILQVSTSASSLIIAKRAADCQAGNGFVLNNNSGTLTLENQEPVFAVQLTGTPTLSVLEERWLDEGED